MRENEFTNKTETEIYTMIDAADSEIIEDIRLFQAFQALKELWKNQERQEAIDQLEFEPLLTFRKYKPSLAALPYLERRLQETQNANLFLQYLDAVLTIKFDSNLFEQNFSKYFALTEKYWSVKLGQLAVYPLISELNWSLQTHNQELIVQAFSHYLTYIRIFYNAKEDRWLAGLLENFALQLDALNEYREVIPFTEINSILYQVIFFVIEFRPFLLSTMNQIFMKLHEHEGKTLAELNQDWRNMMDQIKLEISQGKSASALESSCSTDLFGENGEILPQKTPSTTAPPNKVQIDVEIEEEQKPQ